MKKTNTATRLKEIMSTYNLRQVDILNKCQPFCQKYNVRLGRNDISQYVSGKVEPGQDKLSILGHALDVSEAWLMGFDVPKERMPVDLLVHTQGVNLFIETKKKPAERAQLERLNKYLTYYRILNEEGQRKVEEYAYDLSHNPKYCVDSSDILQAAHERTDIEITDEMRKHDDDIMDDENF